jgi:hypothetical protein
MVGNYLNGNYSAAPSHFNSRVVTQRRKRAFYQISYFLQALWSLLFDAQL